MPIWILVVVGILALIVICVFYIGYTMADAEFYREDRLAKKDRKHHQQHGDCAYCRRLREWREQ